MADKLVAIDDDTGAMSPLVKDAFGNIVDDVASPYVSDAQDARDQAQSYRNAAQSAASDASDSADSASSSASDASNTADNVQSVMSNAADQVRNQVSNDADRAESAASDAESYKDQASSFASSASDSASSASGAESGAQNARDSAQAAQSSAENARDDAKTAANSFDLSATADTLSPGSSATVSVSGSGPSYDIDFGIPRGDEGPKGPKGDVGSGMELSGRVDTYGDLPSNLGSSDAGRAYKVDGDGLIYIWDGSAWPSDGNGDDLQGPKGDTGPKGDEGPKGDTGPAGPPNSLDIGTVESGSSPDAEITGSAPSQTLNLTLERGPKGDDGPRGPKGDTGDQGEPGQASHLSIGTVDTGPSSASITGSPPNQTLNLTLERGPQGDEGPKGEQGPKGDKGTTDYAELTNVPSTFPPEVGDTDTTAMRGDAFVVVDSLPSSGDFDGQIAFVRES